jgi:hypothetical protein
MGLSKHASIVRERVARAQGSGAVQRPARTGRWRTAPRESGPHPHRTRRESTEGTPRPLPTPSPSRLPTAIAPHTRASRIILFLCQNSLCLIPQIRSIMLEYAQLCPVMPKIASKMPEIPGICRHIPAGPTSYDIPGSALPLPPPPPPPHRDRWIALATSQGVIYQ